MSSVTVVCPNARRCPVKVTPGMLLRQIVEEACLKHGYDVNEFAAYNLKKVLDLSLPFRLSGLSNNATIELVPAATKGSGFAEIALQMSNGTRKQLKLSTSLTLHEILVKFSEAFGEDLTSVVSDSVPSCMFMNKHYTGDELQQRTLSSIGITSGKCLIRYQRIQLTAEKAAELAARLSEENRRKELLDAKFEQMKVENEERDRIEAERLKRFEDEVRQREEEARKERERMALEQPMETNEEPVPRTRDILGDVTSFQRDRMPTPPPANTNEWSFDAPVFAANAPVAPSSDRLANLSRLLQQVDDSLTRGTHDHLVDVIADQGRVSLSQIAAAATVMEQDQPTQSEASPSFAEPCERRAAVFTKESPIAVVSTETENFPDEFFEVGVDDLKSRQRQLREQVRAQTQRALLPRSFIEKKNRVLKMAAYPNSVIRFTVGSVIVQGNFRSGEPVTRLFDFFASLLSQPAEFSLNFALNCPIERCDSKNLIDVDVAPKTTLFVKFKQAGTDFASLMKKDGVTLCSQQDADKMSAEWLSPNTVFHPYTGATVPEEPRTVKRVGPDASQEHQPPQKSAAPKWLKPK